jgi:DNA polymerase-3 subunit epsilon
LGEPRESSQPRESPKPGEPSKPREPGEPRGPRGPRDLRDEGAARLRAPWRPGPTTVALALMLAWLGALGYALWADLAPAEQQAAAALLAPRGGLLWLFALVLPLLLWAALRPWVVGWSRAARRLREEVDIVAAAHAGHGITVAGAPEMRELATSIAALARQHAALRSETDLRIAEARAALAEETRRLAALMAELTFGVLVCNREGRILLYNARAQSLLTAPTEAPDGWTPAPLGLGRAIGSVLDAGAIEHAWRQLERRHASGDRTSGSSDVPPAALRPARFVAGIGPTSPRRDAALLRVQMVPTLDDAGALGGYVLLLEDITRPAAEHGRRDAALQRLVAGTRGALANLRAAAETLRAYPAMDAARRQRLSAVVGEEAERVAADWTLALADAEKTLAGGWLLDDVQADDLGPALQRSLRDGAGIACEVETPERRGGQGLWIAADSRALVQALATLAQRLVAENDARDLLFAARDADGAVRIELGFSGTPLQAGRLAEWESAADAAGSGGAAPGASLRQVLDRHGAECWPRTEPNEANRHLVCIQFGRAGNEPPARAAATASTPGATAGRPIAYDFDLFGQAGQSAALDETPLAALTYTVFDTETTGLRPSEGDEIIAIGAVRIVNARLLEHERFDRRVRPRRAVRASAEAVHGISTAALEGEPPLERVLPAFASFCEETVLVAHNAAFDLRFLELARERTGVRFDQPVLDTMLLSAVVQPGHRADEHHLEQIAARLGVPLEARHQALGDAITAGRVLLKLLPLLADRGIRTLGQAREASRRAAAADATYDASY